mmetsp:Transcript_4142/g.11378  ORF Transcript_4142/g.11378 Transcript_4142/m.11378 type:complete len:112 (-) Transcript_4142:1379-1714(-)
MLIMPCSHHTNEIMSACRIRNFFFLCFDRVFRPIISPLSKSWVCESVLMPFPHTEKRVNKMKKSRYNDSVHISTVFAHVGSGAEMLAALSAEHLAGPEVHQFCVRDEVRFL